MKQTIKDIRKELLGHVDLAYKQGSKTFFREEVHPLGVRAATVRKISVRYFKEVKPLGKAGVFALAEALLKRGTMEEGMIAFDWARRFEKEFAKSDFKTFEHWLKTYVHNWAHCDDFCTHAFGALVNRYPELVNKTIPWRRSRNRWVRRASAVVLIYPWTKPNTFLKEIFETADALLMDEDDLVQKGYGWMLKVAADHHPEEVFDFVMDRKNRMPRTALRYAIEKMPKKWKAQAMLKD